ncbi:Dabb family protein [Microbacterium sp. ET2]|uniref:Dabb family protein n=1 Tax=Microbacterium albipurpureum TaxID=3050384 RepID=UPI00259CEE29|nr:Dabb family protein [Microbacterium sp. ET2 (Ac-2212)]WJL96667.1 Dabb family protein [Microbacterium sp. ET2 (Ac-2212)]
MFRHVVMWRVNADDTRERARICARIVEAMSPLPGQIPEIRSMRLDLNDLLPDENADLVLTLEFDDADAFAVYRHHPSHLAVSPSIAALYRTRLAVDFYVRE